MQAKIGYRSAIMAAGMLLLAACGSSHLEDEVDGISSTPARGHRSIIGDNTTNVQTSGLGNRSRFPGAHAGEVNPDTGKKFNTVYFAYDNSTIRADDMKLIRTNAAYLKSHPNATLRLEGNTDPRGSREYNIGLGQRRGNSVEDTMEMLGVPRAQLVVVSYGKEKLAVTGNSDADYILDRRVEMVYERT